MPEERPDGDEMKLVLVAGGSCDPLWLKKELTPLLCSGWKCMGIDAGVLKLLSAGFRPDHVIGDFDSVTPEEREKILTDYPEQTVLRPEKDDTDMEAALRLAVQFQVEEILICGAIGSRMDHTLANLRLLDIPFQAGIPAVLLDPCNRIRLIREELHIRRSEQYGRYVSLLPFDGPVGGLSLYGFKYTLEDAELVHATSLGISNEIVAEEGVIRLRSGRLLVIESQDQTGF